MAYFDKKTNECLQCGEAFAPPSANPKKKYCTVQCARIGGGKNITISKTLPGSTIFTNGYRVIPIPHDHISRSTTRRKRNERVYEHVAVAENVLGRPLRRGEVVHHINCDKLDNRSENLLICTPAYHAWLHGEMSRRWAQENFS